MTSLNVGTTFWSQASVAVGVAKLGVAGHSIDDGAGRAEITGAVLSCTSTFVAQVTGVAPQLVQVKLEVNVNPPQTEPGFTETVVPVLPPLKEAPEVLALKDQVIVDWPLQVPLTVTE